MFLKSIKIIAILIFPAWVLAQTTATFEEFGLEQGEFLNGSDLSGGFQNGNIYLPNDYNPDYDAWRGWSISATTDTITPGFNNLYSAVTGSGFSDSRTYAVTYAIDEPVIRTTGNGSGGVVEGFYITNSTIAYRSMLEGDAFAKKFGGVTGDDPDFYVLIVKKYLDGALHADSVTFYLADYRFDDNSKDYIVKDWTWLDLSSLGNADSLHIRLNSSDVGMFGMNTPALFCIDDLVTRDNTTATRTPVNTFPGKIYPNPARDMITIESDLEGETEYVIYQENGQQCASGKWSGFVHNVDISLLNPGKYFLVANNDDKVFCTSFLVVE